SAESLDLFEQRADAFNFYPPKLPLVSGQVGGVVAVHKSLGGGFWREMFSAERGSKDEAIAAFVQLGCEGVLQFGSSEFETASPLDQFGFDCWQSLPASDESSVGMHLMETLGELYKRGCNPAFAALYPSAGLQRVKLPGYPFEKQRYWITEISQFMNAEEELEQTSVL
ncbi:MAG: hypothetical protein VXZ84_08840, partial [Planctomycetota bacterium]|nr:hypothetical protein [Planctomycetota bacterium]